MLKNLLFFATIGITFCCASVPDIYNERELTGKVALITGAAQGIGKSIAKKFLEANVELIIILDKEAELGKQTSEEFNANYGENKTVFIACHIATDFDKIADEIINKFGYIDILVNNAALVDEYDPDPIIETNLLALVKWSWKFYNIMRQDRGGSCGTIINISSALGYLIQPFVPIYSATKYGVIGYTRGMGHEYNYKHSCVRVVAICPGFTQTRLIEQQFVWDEQIEIFQKFMAASSWQQPDCVGDAAVKIFQNADSGTVWDSIGCQEPTESPHSGIVSADFLESL